jgi:murein DD-endopeptidase
VRSVARTLAVLLLVAGGGSWASRAQLRTQTRAPLLESVDIQIPVAPTPVRIAGKRHLVYELHLTNLRAIEVALTRIEMMDAGSKARLADYRGSELAGRLGRPGAGSDLKDRRLIGGGMRAVVYLWLV